MVSSETDLHYFTSDLSCFILGPHVASPPATGPIRPQWVTAGVRWERSKELDPKFTGRQKTSKRLDLGPDSVCWNGPPNFPACQLHANGFVRLCRAEEPVKRAVPAWRLIAHGRSLRDRRIPRQRGSRSRKTAVPPARPAPWAVRYPGRRPGIACAARDCRALPGDRRPEQAPR